jgi:Tol biopolymer transport system component
MSKLAFRSDRNGTLDIYVVNADGSGSSRITSNTADDAIFLCGWR